MREAGYALQQADQPEELVRQITAGDRDAEQTLVRRYSRGLMFMLKRRTRDTQLAEDLHQDTFRIVIERLRSKGLDNPKKLSAFIHRTAINLHIGEIRRDNRRKTDIDMESIDRYPDDRAGQLDDLLRSEAAGAVRSLINDLKKPRDRELIRRFYIFEQEKEVICQSLGLTARHFDRVISRARARFRTLTETKLDSSEMMDNVT